MHSYGVYSQLKAAIERSFKQFALIQDEFVQLHTSGLLTRKHEPAELKTMLDKLIDRMDGPKRALENLVKVADQQIKGANELTKGAAPADRSVAYGYRGELQGHAKRLKAMAEDQLKALNDWVNRAHAEKSGAGSRMGGQLDLLDEIRTKYKEHRSDATILQDSAHLGPDAKQQVPHGDPGDALISILIILVTVFNRRSKEERKRLASA